MKIVYTRRSQADLEAIFDHGLQWGKLHAMRVERRIRTECASLAKFPELGIKTDIKGVRRFPIVRYPLTIFYRIDAVHAKLEILRIVRSAAIRDLNQPPD